MILSLLINKSFIKVSFYLKVTGNFFKNLLLILLSSLVSFINGTGGRVSIKREFKKNLRLELNPLNNRL
jgi:hypothetical protein